MTGTPDRRIDIYLAKHPDWAAEMAELRRIMLSFPVTETLKWRQPCYTTEHGNIAIVSHLKAGATISFMRGALMQDPENLLIRPGEHSRIARYMIFTAVDEVRDKEAVVRDYVGEALKVHESGQKVDLSQNREIAYPDELTAALDADPALAEGWADLTPGRQRGYLVFFSGAKQSQTRTNRIAKHRGRIIDGLGMHDR